MLCCVLVQGSIIACVRRINFGFFFTQRMYTYAIVAFTGLRCSAACLCCPAGSFGWVILGRDVGGINFECSVSDFRLGRTWLRKACKQIVWT